MQQRDTVSATAGWSRATPRWIALAVLLLAAFVVPVEIAARHDVDGLVSPALHALSLLASLGVLAGLASLLGGRIAALLLAAGLGLMALVRAVYFGLVQFSGRGFNTEVFIHLEPESFRVAWMEYPLLCVAAALGGVLLFGLFLWLGGRVARLRRARALLLLACALPALALARSGSPEWALARAVMDWYGPKSTGLAPARLARWQASPLVDLDVPPKDAVVAQVPARPRNLILLYIESGGLSLVGHPDWPGLMPVMEGLQARHAFVESLYTSGYITIEGMVNSQCGTLFPFERGSESLAGFDGLAESQACLGDVLAKAGYRQSYLGGADLRFAGKGRFLLAHGMDKVMGQEEWAAQGLHQRPDTWGVSDADLFDQSLVELDALRASGQPFALSLLTIGTHLPGYSYAECAPYPLDAHRFLQALHCTDQLLGRWLERLQAAGVLDDTLVVVTADHHVFPSPDMRALFGDRAVEDRRLPMIVLGDTAGLRPQVAQGASYDLAPTLLDLLGIEHTARFVLGRSLLRPEAQRPYLVSRYIDLHDGRTVTPQGEACAVDADAQADPSVPIPLDRCAKDELLTLLRAQNARFSERPPVIACADEGIELARLPSDPAAAVSIQLGGHEQAQRFTWAERSLLEARHGLFLLGLDADGQLTRRWYAPSAEAAALAPEPPDLGEAATLLALWRPATPDEAAPGWLVQRTGATGAGAWLLDLPSGALLAQAEAVDEAVSADGAVNQAADADVDADAATLRLDRTACLATFGRGPRALLARHFGL